MSLGDAIGEVVIKGAVDGAFHSRVSRFSPFDIPKVHKPKKREGGPQDRSSYWREKLRKELPG